MHNALDNILLIELFRPSQLMSDEPNSETVACLRCLRAATLTILEGREAMQESWALALALGRGRQQPVDGVAAHPAHVHAHASPQASEMGVGKVASIKHLVLHIEGHHRLLLLRFHFEGRVNLRHLTLKGFRGASLTLGPSNHGIYWKYSFTREIKSG